MSEMTFEESVNAQVALLENGRPLDAFDKFFAFDGVMYANDQIFADSAAEAREKQERYILAATSIDGCIVDLRTNAQAQICVFRNRSSFTTSNGAIHKIDGLCWQLWSNGKVVVERYFEGAEMEQQLAAGILDKPENLTPIVT